MKKIVTIAAALLVAMPSIFAQKAVEQVVEYTGFKNVDACDNIEVKYVRSNDYSVVLSVDERIVENVIAVVKSNTLMLDIDEKGYSKELKSELKSKNATQPFVIAEVHAPGLNKVILRDDAVFSASETIQTDEISFTLEDNATVKSLVVEANAVKITVIDKTTCRFDLRADEVEFASEDSASATLLLNCGNFIMTSENSSNVTGDGEFRSVSVTAKNSSKVTLTGNASKVTVSGANSSTTNLESLTTKEADVALTNSAVCKINAKEHLKVELLNSSHLIYNSSPAFEIERIVGSTLTKSSDTAYNKNK